MSTSNTLYYHCSNALCNRGKEEAKGLDMKPHRAISERVEGLKMRRHGLVALLGVLLLPLFFFVVLKPSLSVTSGLDLQRSSITNARIHAVEENTSISDEPEDTTDNLTSTRDVELHDTEDKQEAHDIIAGNSKLEGENRESKLSIGDVEPHGIEDKQEAHDIVAGQPHWEQENSVGNFQFGVAPNVKEGKKEYDDTVPGETPPKSPIMCDFSTTRSDTCVMEGDIRVLPQFSTLVLVEEPPQGNTEPQNSWKVRPYARKWEAPVMEQIKQVTVKGPVPPQESPQCDIRHAVPAIIFSTGGFQGNFFHDFTDVLIPLFITARQYDGEVQFLVTNYNGGWINKYQAMLKQLSRYEVVNLDWEGQTRCFPKAHVGLISHKELGINAVRSPNGHSMADFRELLRASFSLKRKSVSTGAQRPRLLIIHRKGSRSLMNKDQVVTMARRVGYKVVLAGPEKTRNLARFARVVNSCDVMMGVHGAGLTNMIFLPINATLIQVVPWGGLGYACRHDFGNPAPDMGLKYLEYEIKEEESSLVYQYPRDHPVFTDPLSIHKQGWNALWYVFLHQQHVRLDVRRIRGVLQEALRSLR